MARIVLLSLSHVVTDITLARSESSSSFQSAASLDFLLFPAKSLCLVDKEDKLEKENPPRIIVGDRWECVDRGTELSWLAAFKMKTVSP